MPRRDPVQDVLDELAELRKRPMTPSGLEAIEAALDHKSGLVVATAAEIAGEHELEALAPRLVQAFERFLTDPVKRDPGCRAKIAVAGALARMGHDAEAVFRRGVRHVQREPVWGGSEDTAGELRAICIAALLSGQYEGASMAAADLLADPEPWARAGSARALAATGSLDIAVPLLRLKVQTREDNPQVLSACFGALLALSPESLPLVASFLASEHAVAREAAALALGESRLADAFEPLRAMAGHKDATPSDIRVAFVAMAMLRIEPAWVHLLEQITDAYGGTARIALEVLAPYRHDLRLRERIEGALEARGDATLRAHAARVLAGQ